MFKTSKQMTRLLAMTSLLSVLFIGSLQAKEKVIIDADVGIDDAMAILLTTASPEIDLVGITTIFGNASIENSTKNALYLLQRTGLKIPVAKGASVPLVIPAEPPTDFVHGQNGLGNVAVPEEGDTLLSSLSAAEFIIEQSKRYPNELILAPIGRLTNIALALRLDPTLASRIKKVVLMGGAFDVSGNVTPVAEANIIGDPHAADIVFQADWDVVAIGLDVTTQIIVNDDDLKSVQQSNPIAGKFIRDFSQFYLDFYRSVGVTQGFYVHDPAAIMYIIRPELFANQTAPIRVVTQGIAIGQTIAAIPPMNLRLKEWKNVKLSQYANSVNHQQARALFLSRLSKVKFVE
jgi:purine nucleosidase